MKCDRCGCELVKFTGVDYTASIKWHDEEIKDRKLFTLCIVSKDLKEELVKTLKHRKQPIVPSTITTRPFKHNLCEKCCKELEKRIIGTINDFIKEQTDEML